MTKYKLLILSLLFFTLTCLHNLDSQVCSNYYKSSSCSEYQKKGFYLHGQSRSAIMEIGVESQFEVVLKGGYDYIVSFCTESKFYPIHFVIEAKDGSNVLYDNMHDDYINSVGFTLENTQTVVVSVILIADKFKPSDFEENRSCVGFNLQFRTTPDFGFE